MGRGQSHQIGRPVRLIGLLERGRVTKGVRLWFEDTGAIEDLSLLDFIFLAYGVGGYSLLWVNVSVDSHLYAIVQSAKTYVQRNEPHKAKYLIGEWVSDIRKWATLTDGSLEKLPVIDKDKGYLRNSNMVMIQSTVEDEGLFVGALGIQADGRIDFYTKIELVELFKRGFLHNAHFKNAGKTNFPGFSANRGKFASVSASSVTVRDFRHSLSHHNGVD